MNGKIDKCGSLHIERMRSGKPEMIPVFCWNSNVPGECCDTCVAFGEPVDLGPLSTEHPRRAKIQLCREAGTPAVDEFVDERNPK